LCGQERERERGHRDTGTQGHRDTGTQGHRDGEKQIDRISRQGEAWKGREGQAEIRAGQSNQRREDGKGVEWREGEWSVAAGSDDEAAPHLVNSDFRLIAVVEQYYCWIFMPRIAL
jgi:hypothetical protein